MLTLADTKLTYKTCTKCKELKTLNCFGKHSSAKDGLKSRCKVCANKDTAQRRLDNPEKSRASNKKYTLANKEKINAHGREHYLNNIEKEKERSKKYRLNNPEKAKARNKKWQLANTEKIAAQRKQRKLANPEKKRAYGKKYRLDNAAEIKVSKKQYNLANPHKGRQYQSTRRARKLDNGVFKILDKEMERLYASPCFYCGSNESIQADHVIPIKRGGVHSIGNLVPACASCNGSKSDRLLIHWKATKTDF